MIYSRNDVKENEPTTTTYQFEYDMGWQKCGSGKAYDSKCGVRTLIGNRTGKLCGYAIKIVAFVFIILIRVRFLQKVNYLKDILIDVKDVKSSISIRKDYKIFRNC